MRRTHDDLLRAPRSRPAVEFFLEHLYAPKDMSRREQDLARIAPILNKTLTASSLHTIALALEMNVLTDELDAALLLALDPGTDPGGMSDAAYAEAYRACDDFPRRRRQIELIGEVGHLLDEVVRLPGAYMALRLAGPPARLAGLSELHRFLMDGFKAFRHMGGADDFLAAIVTRETEILGRIRDRHPRPFDGPYS